MSRAFIKETDDAAEELAERPISTNPNLVTPQGLAAIDGELSAINAALARTDGRDQKARLARDLRYWTARRASAQVIAGPAGIDAVQFGSVITIDRADGRREEFRIVGEDEADPRRGTIAYTSPLARALMGKSVGDSARVNGMDIDLVALG